MKTLSELKEGDLVKVEWTYYNHFSRASETRHRFASVRKVTNKLILVSDERFDRSTGNSRSTRSCRKLRVPTPEDLRVLEAERAKEHAERVEREAVRATEEYRLASMILGYGNCMYSEQLMTMPIDRLRQIVAWLDEHKP